MFNRNSIIRLMALLTAILLAGSACGSSTPTDVAAEPSVTTVDGSGTTTGDDGAADDVASPTTAPPTETPSTAAGDKAPVTTAPPVTGADDVRAPQEGGPIGINPGAGTHLAVIGVQYDDELNFRSAPGVGNDIMFSVPPLNDDYGLVATGDDWLFDGGGLWWKVMSDGVEAWANQAYLAALGDPIDIFDDVAAEMGVLKAEDMEDLAEKVVAARGYADEPVPTVTYVGEPLAFSGFGGFVVVDVIGLGDDALKGERLRIEADLAQDEEDGPVLFVVLTSVEMTPLCGRGVSNGLCL